MRTAYEQKFAGLLEAGSFLVIPIHSCHIYALKTLDEQPLLRKRRMSCPSSNPIDRSLLLGIHSQYLVVRDSTLAPQVCCAHGDVSN